MTAVSIQRYVASEIQSETLNTIINHGQWRWVYAEQQKGTELTWFETLAADESGWEQWQHGRLFDQHHELTWWREQNGRFTCRLLTTQTPPTSINWDDGETYDMVVPPDSAKETRLKPGAERTLMHGRWNPGSTPPTWSEPRIPRYLAYPVEPTLPIHEETRAILTTCIYRGLGGDLLTRLVSVDIEPPGGD